MSSERQATLGCAAVNACASFGEPWAKALRSRESHPFVVDGAEAKLQHSHAMSLEPPCAVTLVEADGRVVLTLAGELDHLDAGGFDAHVARLSADPPADVLIVATAVTFIDSFIVGQFALLERAVLRAGGTLAVDPSPNVRRVVELVGLQRLLAD